MIIVGLDWSQYKHDFVIMDMQGKIIERGAIAHNANALEELAAGIDCHVNCAAQVHGGKVADTRHPFSIFSYTRHNFLAINIKSDILTS